MTEDPQLYRFRVYANEGPGMRKDRRVVRAATSAAAIDAAKEARGGWGAKSHLTVKRLGPVKGKSEACPCP